MIASLPLLDFCSFVILPWYRPSAGKCWSFFESSWNLLENLGSPLSLLVRLCHPLTKGRRHRIETR